MLDDLLDLFDRDRRSRSSHRKSGLGGLLQRLTGDDDHRRDRDDDDRRRGVADRRFDDDHFDDDHFDDDRRDRRRYRDRRDREFEID